MNILHVTNHFSPCVGGIEKAVEGLCRELIERGHTSDVACLDTCAYTKDRLPSIEEYEGIKIHRFSYLNLKFYKIAPSVLRLLKRYDIIHVHGVGFFSDFLAITKPIHKKPLILNTHGGFFHTKKLERLKKAYLLWNRVPFRAYEKVVADSRNDEAIFSPVSRDMVRIPNGVRLDEFQMDWKPDPKTLLYVGRLSKNKRIDLLIETVALLRKTVPGIKLDIVGEDWEGIQKDLETLVEKRGVRENVSFLGRVGQEDLQRRLSTAGFFVSASQYEGFGISAIEAMASGCVVVLNDIPAFREFVNHGKNGFLVDFGQRESAATLLAEFIEKDLRDVSKEARQSASGYDLKTVALKIEDIYARAIAKK